MKLFLLKCNRLNTSFILFWQRKAFKLKLNFVLVSFVMHTEIRRVTRSRILQAILKIDFISPRIR